MIMSGVNFLHGSFTYQNNNSNNYMVADVKISSIKYLHTYLTQERNYYMEIFVDMWQYFVFKIKSNKKKISLFSLCFFPLSDQIPNI